MGSSGHGNRLRQSIGAILKKGSDLSLPTLCGRYGGEASPLGGAVPGLTHSSKRLLLMRQKKKKRKKNAHSRQVLSACQLGTILTDSTVRVRTKTA